MVTRAILAGIGVATPPPMPQADLWDGYFAARGGSPRAERIFANSGVDTRHAVANPLVEDVSGWSTGQRMRRYETESQPLGKDALTRALAEADVRANDLGALVVVSCTGYATPGLDLRLAADLGMPSDLHRLVIGHMGCYAALPALRAAADQVRLHRRPVALLCVELPSLHVQRAIAEDDQAVAHSLFSDAAAAAVLVPGDGPGLAVEAVTARTDTAYVDEMTWHVTDEGFRMGLGIRVPLVLARNAKGAVDALLRPVGRTTEAVDAYAVHPGGPRILDAVQKGLALPEEALADSRAVLREHGNCSSPTVLMVLDRTLRAERTSPRKGDGGMNRADTIVAMAFGPGLTLYSAVFVRH